MRNMTVVPVLILLVACASHLETRGIDPTILSDAKNRPVIDGVVFYQPQYVLIRYEFRTRVDSSGKVDFDCTPVRQKDEIQIMPDFDRPYVIRQTGGFLTSNKLGLTLANGLLTGVNVESSTKLPETLAAVLSAVTTAAPSKLAKPACNAGPMVAGFWRTKLDTLPR
jgi:hypothetical protein